MFSVAQLKAGLNTEFLGREVKYLEKIGSTNDESWESFYNGAPAGSLIITDNQFEGRGRRQSKWVSIPGKSLTFSFLLLPEIPLEKLGLLPLLAGVSIVKGIKTITSLCAGLKWPNDIIISNKKMGGILIESHMKGEKLGVVVGIGLNINESENDFSEEIQKEATSLFIDSGKEYNLELILSSILNEFENLYLYNWHNFISIWKTYCIHQNNKVTFHNNNKYIQGTFLGITELGYAKIQLNKKTEIFSSGMVSL